MRIVLCTYPALCSLSHQSPCVLFCFQQSLNFLHHLCPANPDSFFSLLQFKSYKGLENLASSTIHSQFCGVLNLFVPFFIHWGGYCNCTIHHHFAGSHVAYLFKTKVFYAYWGREKYLLKRLLWDAK